MNKSIFIIVVLLIVTTGMNARQKGVSELRGPYLGQAPPGETPRIFAPGIVSTGANEMNICFSADGRELFYSMTGPAFKPRIILSSAATDSGWSRASELPFFDPARTDGYPFLSPDGKKLFFNSSRPRRGNDPSGLPRSGDIWVAERVNGKWGSPKRIDFGEQFKGNRGFPSVASNGNMYFFAMFNGEKAAIYISRYQNGKYADPEKLGEGVNGNGSAMNFHPFIAPDESFLLFDSRREEDNRGLNDIYVCFRKQDGTWSRARNLGETINSPAYDLRPFVTVDGKYLFFASNRESDTLFPKKRLNIDGIRHFLNPPGNGSQDIYWVDAKIIHLLKGSEFEKQ